MAKLLDCICCVRQVLVAYLEAVKPKIVHSEAEQTAKLATKVEKPVPTDDSALEKSGSGGMPVYLLVEKERKRHQATIERLLASNKKKDGEIESLKGQIINLRQIADAGGLNMSEPKWTQLGGRAEISILQPDLLQTKSAPLPPIGPSDASRVGESTIDAIQQASVSEYSHSLKSVLEHLPPLSKKGGNTGN